MKKSLHKDTVLNSQDANFSH